MATIHGSRGSPPRHATRQARSTKAEPASTAARHPIIATSTNRPQDQRDATTNFLPPRSGSAAGTLLGNSLTVELPLGAGKTRRGPELARGRPVRSHWIRAFAKWARELARAARLRPMTSRCLCPPRDQAIGSLGRGVRLSAPTQQAAKTVGMWRNGPLCFVLPHSGTS